MFGGTGDFRTENVPGDAAGEDLIHPMQQELLCFLHRIKHVKYYYE